MIHRILAHSILGTLSVCILSQYFLNTASAEQTQKLLLSGRDKDDTVEWDFFCTSGRKSGAWGKILVPSNWELQGYGEYNYGRDKHKADEQGKYRHTFTIPAPWKGSPIEIVFEGVMTDAEVKINGESAGPIHQGGFYQFRYNITDLVKFDEENLLEVDVAKVSANSSIEIAERKADYWVFGGIYRPVYLEAKPAESIERVAVDAKSDGTFRMDVFLQGIEQANHLTAQLIDSDNNVVGEPFSAQVDADKNEVELSTQVSQPRLWTAETPQLYTVEVSLLQGKQPIHTLRESFGFRTIEVRGGDGIYVNGTKIRLKGVNRHAFWPDSGRCLSRQVNENDIRLMKDMNMNAVRMSHYPPDRGFLDLCDQLGLYVIDELCTWQAPVIDTQQARRLVKELVVRDVNHPSILLWANGNEGGWNSEVDGDFERYDPQERTVIHPWESFNALDTDHYESYASVAEKLQGKDLYLPTELLHGLYDGGLGAGLADYWKLIRESKLGAGLFLWALVDEGVVRTDQHGRVDVNGNQAPDGIVGPYREREASYYTIKEVWSPIRFTTRLLPDDLAQRSSCEIAVENDFDFRNLQDCKYRWQWLKFPGPDLPTTSPKLLESGSASFPDTPPKGTTKLAISIPENIAVADALRLVAVDSEGKEICARTWSLPLDDCSSPLPEDQKLGHAIQLQEVDSRYVVTAGKSIYTFTRDHGQLVSVRVGGNAFSLHNGPRLVYSIQGQANQVLPGKITGKLDTIIKRVKLTSNNQNSDFRSLEWTIYPSGLLELKYKATCPIAPDTLGITFEYPEERVLSLKWLGMGPYRIWRNRTQGGQLGVWQNSYNDNVPGKTWQYPEFKGYFGNVEWAKWQTTEGGITVLVDGESQTLRNFTPQHGKDPRHTAVEFPPGDISFMHQINPIGTKFLTAAELSPAVSSLPGPRCYSGKLLFQFD